MSEDGSATIRKWEKKIAKDREAGENAPVNMKKVIAAAMKDEGTHKNIVRELRDASKGGYRINHREGYGDDGEVITGYDDDSPWKRD